MRRRTRERAPWFLWAGAIAAAGASLIPLWSLLDGLFSAGTSGLSEILDDGQLAHVLWASTSLAATVAIITAVLGTTTAWLLDRVALPASRWWHVAITLPLAVPSYVSAYAWVNWLPSISGFWGAVIVLSACCTPIVHLSVSAGLAQLDRSQEEVARSLGWRLPTILARLTLPQLRRHLSSGVLLVILYVLSDFGVVAVMRYEAFTWVIYGAYRSGFDPARAALLATTLVVLAIIVVTLESLGRGKLRATTVGSRVSVRPTTTRSPMARVSAAIFLTLLAAVSMGVPVVRAVVWISRDVGAGVPMAEFVDAFTSTVMLTIVATIATIALALPVALLVARYPSPSAHALERSVYVVHSLPGVVMAISFVFVATSTTWLADQLYQTTPFLIAAYVSLVASLAVGAIRASAERLPEGLVDSARSLGWTRGQTLRRLLIPLTRGGIAAGAAMVALTVVKELPTTLLLAPIGMNTLATRTWTYTAVADDAGVGPYALSLIALSVIPAAGLALRRAPSR